MESNGSRVVIGLGGNALIKKGQRGTVYEQFANARQALGPVVEMIRRGTRVILTHGNGPQVGNIIIRVREALGKAYDVPLGVAVAESQGEMGYMIEQTLQNRMILEKIPVSVVTVLTQVVCARDDPSLKKPDKPIGPFYTKEQAETLRKAGLKIVEDSGRGWRHVVPSPNPLTIVEKDAIRRLMDLGVVVIAAGGGGMPVYVQDDGTYEGIDAVVDKDLASAILASDVGADEMYILTSVDTVMLDFLTPNPKPIRNTDSEELKRHLADGQFAPGSMGPKIRAVIRFLEEGGKRALVTSADTLLEALEGKTGTWVVPGTRRFPEN
jgi:carbamate kinase